MYCRNCGNPTKNGSEYCDWCDPKTQKEDYYYEEEDSILYYFIKALKSFGDFSSRARRKEYWSYVLVNFILSIVVTILSFIPLVNLLVWIMCALYGLFAWLPGLAVTVRRLHDINKSGWFVFVSLIPFVGWIFMLIMMVQEGTPGYNDYGPDPKDW